jgi:hypothetical protein
VRRLATAIAAATLALTAAPGLSGCVTPGGVSIPASAQATATKAMIDCETAYQAIAISVNQGKASGLLTGDKATKAESVKVQAWAALQVARSVYRAGRSPSVATLAALVLQIEALTGVHLNV